MNENFIQKIAYWLALFLIFTIPWEGVLEFEILGTMSQVAGLLLGGIWIIKIIANAKIRRPHVFHIVFAAFAIWHFLSLFWTIDFDKSMVRYHTYLQLFILAYIIWDLFRSERSIKGGLQAYVLGAWVSIGSLIFNYLSGTKATYFRYSATGFDSNNIGIILAIGIVIAWYLNSDKSKTGMWNILKFLNYIYLPLAIFGILLTGSRAALITAGFSFIYVIGSADQLKISTRIIMYLFIVSATYGVFTLIPEGIVDRLSTTIDSVSNADLGGRVAIWRASLDVIEQYPILGVGTNAFPSATELGKAAHNTYLSILAEVGIIGFGLFTIAIVIALIGAIKHPENERKFWIALLITLALGILTLNWAHRKPTWLIPSLLVASANISVRRNDEIPELIAQNNTIIEKLHS